MIDEKIDTLKKELDNLIANNATYEEIFKVSKQIDEYIVKFYKEQN